MATAVLVTLGPVVALTWPQMNNPSGLAAQLGLRIVQKLLDHWKTKLSCHDRLLLTSYTSMVVEEEPFSAIFLPPDFKDCSGPLLKDSVFVSLQVASLYELLKTVDRQKLNQRAWRMYLGLAPACKPQRRALYKPPFSKGHADLHWRVFHSIFPVNSFVSTVNEMVEDECPLCDHGETIFHCFYERQCCQPEFF